MTVADMETWFPKNYAARDVTPPDMYWIAQMQRFNLEERRWVNKGPVLLYLLQGSSECQLVGNYLYSTKSIAMNLSSNNQICVCFNI